MTPNGQYLSDILSNTQQNETNTTHKY